MSLRTKGQRQILQVLFAFDIAKKKLIRGKTVNPVLTLIIGTASFSFYKPSVSCRICLICLFYMEKD